MPGGRAGQLGPENLHGSRSPHASPGCFSSRPLRGAAAAVPQPARVRGAVQYEMPGRSCHVPLLRLASRALLSRPAPRPLDALVNPGPVNDLPAGAVWMGLSRDVRGPQSTPPAVEACSPASGLSAWPRAPEESVGALIGLVGRYKSSARRSRAERHGTAAVEALRSGRTHAEAGHCVIRATSAQGHLLL